jgi:transglutaminase-like putative cysteine protease
VPLRRIVTIICLAVSLVLAAGKYFSSTVCAGIGFQTVSPEELKMTSEPLAPGAPAIILYRQVDRDDNGRTSHEDNYIRIKILTEEGRKHANIEIPFFRGFTDVSQVRGRTIRPDGSIAEFDGKVLEQELVKAQGMKVLAKTLSLPDAQPGSIVEYFYTIDYVENRYFESHWILNENLFTRKARFSLKPYERSGMHFAVRWSWQNLPPGVDPPKEAANHIIGMEVSNVPAFVEEDFMPPEDQVRSHVDFAYQDLVGVVTPAEYWKRFGKERNAQLESFIGKRKAMEEAVAQIIAPNDSPEIKLRKIYDRVQQIRNTSYELRKTEQEQKREKEKAEENVEDLWKRGYGDGVHLTWLYLALLRAAGFEAYGCWVSDRHKYFFDPATAQGRKLDANVVLVKLNGKDLYFDPGGAFTPFGLLTWSETSVRGLRLDKDGGTWIQTTLPQSSESRVERVGKFKLSETGDLEGRVTVTYTGLEAMYYRLDVRHEDEVARKKFLEERVKLQIPAAAEADLTNKPDWNNSETPLVAEFEIKIPGWASNAGKRSLIPAGIFTGAEKHIFEHAERVHPVYFEYPHEKFDDVTVEIPSGWQVGSVPPAQEQDKGVVAYNLTVENGKDSVHLTRKVKVNFLLLETKYYPALRAFFQGVRTADEQQIVLQPGAATAAK